MRVTRFESITTMTNSTSMTLGIFAAMILPALPIASDEATTKSKAFAKGVWKSG